MKKFFKAIAAFFRRLFGKFIINERRTAYDDSETRYTALKPSNTPCARHYMVFDSRIGRFVRKEGRV